MKVQCCFVVCNGAFHTVDFFGSHTLAVMPPADAGVPRSDATGSTRKIQLPQATRLVFSISMQLTPRILQMILAEMII